MSMVAISQGTIISSPQNSICRVFVKIGEFHWQIPVSTHIFHIDGNRCDQEDFTRIFFPGRTVNVSYTFPSNRPRIIAVWRGVKPKSEVDDVAVYNRAGYVTNVAHDFFILYNAYCKHYVIVSNQVVFRDGYPVRNYDLNVKVDDFLRYDAIPLRYAGAIGLEYVATCAWVGINEPRVKDRFHLCFPYGWNLDVDYPDMENVVGYVAFIPNENVALVDVPELNGGKVLMTKESVNLGCESLSDIIGIGDLVLMRLRFGKCFLGPKIWYADAALHIPPSEMVDGQVAILKRKQEVEERSERKHKIVCLEQTQKAVTRNEEPTPPAEIGRKDPGSDNGRDESVPVPENKVMAESPSEEELESVHEGENSTPCLETAPNQNVENSDETQTTNTGTEIELKMENDPQIELEESMVSFERSSVAISLDENDYQGVPFKKSWPCDSPSYLLDWPGLLNMKNGQLKFIPIIESGFVTVSPQLGDVVVSALNDNKPVNSKTLELNRSKVSFDAVCTKTKPRDATNLFRVQRMWFRRGMRPSPELFLISELKFSGPAKLEKEVNHRGSISSIPFHDCAIANVDNVPVLVKFDSLIFDHDVNRKFSTIDMFLDVGISVVVHIKEMRTKEQEIYFVAEKCWKVVLKRTTSEENIPVASAQHAVLRTGLIELQDERPVVRLSRSECVEIEDCKVFIDGLKSEPSMLKTFAGGEISCYVSADKSVTCAWKGQNPGPLALLKDRLSVPKNVISFNRAHEAVIDLLLDYTICKIGVLPVLLGPTERILENSNSVGVVKKNFRKGDRVFLTVKEETFDDSNFLVWKSFESQNDDKLLVNFTGRIVKKPRPIGLIEAIGRSAGEKIFVSFDLSCVRSSFITESESISSWFRYLRTRMQVNKTAFFTARKGVKEEGPHVAYEVWMVGL